MTMPTDDMAASRVDLPLPGHRLALFDGTAVLCGRMHPRVVRGVVP